MHVAEVEERAKGNVQQVSREKEELEQKLHQHVRGSEVGGVMREELQKLWDLCHCLKNVHDPLFCVGASAGSLWWACH